MAQNWIIDNQLNRRNITPDQRTYLVGKRYKEEKKEPTRPKFSQLVRHDAGLIDDNSTANTIGKQSKISHQTVKNAEKFAEAVDKVTEIEGIF